MFRSRFASILALGISLVFYAGSAQAGFYFLTPTGPTDVGAFGVVTFEVFYTSDGDVDPDPGPLDPDNIFSTSLRIGLSDLPAPPGTVATVTANTNANPFFIPVLNLGSLPDRVTFGGSEISGDGLEPLILKLGELTLTGTGMEGVVDLETISAGAIFPSTNVIPDTTAATLATASFFGCPGDMDCDTIPDVSDPCPIYSNLPLPWEARDLNGNGIPTECQCGDFDQDGFYSNADITGIFGCVPGSPFPTDPGICAANIDFGEADGDGNWANNDVTLVFGQVPGTPFPSMLSELVCARKPGP